jgi:hypothetical protein
LVAGDEEALADGEGVEVFLLGIGLIPGEAVN